ncbi:hypothetical protein PQX77_002598, partial [Marasmius sp. AFHP31]
MLSGFFHKARNPHITGGNFNQVQGDQYNNYNYTTIFQAKEEELGEFDEYFKVKRGALQKLKDIGKSAYPRRWDDGDRERWEEGKPRVDRTVCTARVLDQSGMVFTVVQYSGPDARRGFEDDFRMLSRILTSTASQIYGYTRSETPSLILYNELIPAAHLEVGWWSCSYLSSLARQLGCKRMTDELWMDTGRRAFCRGPPGPASLELRGDFEIGDLPLAADFLREDVLLCFLASLKSKKVDRKVVWYSVLRGLPLTSRRVFSQPTVISTLTNTPITVANNAWRSNSSDCLPNLTLLENGLTRFTLTGPPQYISLEWNSNARHAWMSQASSILHACGINTEDDLSVYELFYHSAWLKFIPRLECSEAQRERQSQQPIYLFVRQPPADLSNCETSSLHYWSFHEDGRSPIPRETCHSLGLPIELDFKNSDSPSFSWPSVNYKHLHQYQLARGFNPSTADFARHLGYNVNIFWPANDSDRFEIQE